MTRVIQSTTFQEMLAFVLFCLVIYRSLKKRERNDNGVASQVSPTVSISTGKCKQYYHMYTVSDFFIVLNSNPVTLKQLNMAVLAFILSIRIIRP